MPLKYSKPASNIYFWKLKSIYIMAWAIQTKHMVTKIVELQVEPGYCSKVVGVNLTGLILVRWNPIISTMRYVISHYTCKI